MGTRTRSIRRSDGGLVVDFDRGASALPLRFETDIVTMSHGILPANDVLRLLGCGFEMDLRWNTLVPVRDRDGMTSVDGIYAVGDCARFAGAHVAEIEGTLAGLAAAQSLGFAANIRLEAGLRRRLARHRRFQQRLWQLFDALVPASDAVPPETVICRCEERTQADMAQAIADGAAVIGNLKRITRSGMGPCQGRYCGASARALLRGNARTSPGEDSSWAARPPIKPTAIADLIAGLSRYDA
jgi:NAD(P)H-nitrite reductase large subunit